MSKPAFSTFKIVDRNPLSGRKKIRTIYSPNPEMRMVHAVLIEELSRLDIEMPNATGGVKDMSPLSSLLRHRTNYGFNRYFYLTDIKDAYPSVNTRRLANILATLEDKPELVDYLEDFLERYCSAINGGLATGGPASPFLFNIFCESEIDRKIRELLSTYYAEITYTRFLDDLVFSSNTNIGTRKRRRIRQIITDAGFRINHPKSDVFDIYKGPVMINGMMINKSGKVWISPGFINDLYELLENHVCERIWEPAIVEGKMGVLTHILRKRDRGLLTRQEIRVLNIYAKFRRLKVQNK